MSLVWDVAFPSLPAKMVALKLADCASDTGDSIFPSVQTIMRTTGCVQSTVRKWLVAMEHCELLVVTERSTGGSARNTTRRRFNLELLKDLSEGRKRLVEDTITNINPATSKAVSVTVFRIVDQDTEDGGTPPSNGGVDLADPSATRTPPLRHTEGTPPPHGPEPSLNRHLTLPPNPPGGEGGGEVNLLVDDEQMQPAGSATPFVGFAKGWTDRAQEEICLLLENPLAGHVARDFLAQVVGVLNPPAQVDAVAYVRQLRHQLQSFPADVLSRLAARLIETQHRDLPSTAKLVDQARELQKLIEAKARHERIAGCHPNRARYVVRDGDLQWQPWIEHLRTTGQTETVARAYAARAITVTHKFPQPSAQLVAIGEGHA